MRDRKRIVDGRELLALGAASCVVVAAWAGFPSLVDGNVFIPLPQASAPSATNLVKQGVHPVDGPTNASVATDISLSSEPTAMSTAVNGHAALRNSGGVVDASLIPLRSKLEALLYMLNRFDEVDQPALKAKIQALLDLPDFALSQLMQHPDLANFSRLLDDVFAGRADVSGVEIELGKVEVSTVPGTSDRVHVIKVSGNPAYTVTTPIGEGRTRSNAVPPTPAPPPGEPVQMAFELDAVSATGVTAFAPTASTEELPPPQTPPQARMAGPVLEPVPSIEELPPPSPPAAPVAPSEPTGNPQTPLEVINSGNKFEPGDTAAQPSVESSQPSGGSASTSPTSAVDPAEAGGESSPGGGNEGGAASEGGTGP